MLWLQAHALGSEIKIAVLDTGFCPASFKDHPNIKILAAKDMTQTVALDCSKFTQQQLSSPRFHGQKVLQGLVAGLDRAHQVEIHPLIIFDRHGNQIKEAWLQALDHIKRQGIGLVLAASSFPTKQKIVPDLPGTWFVAAGRAEKGLNQKSVLFPQLLLPLKNIVLIGDFFEGKTGQGALYDQSLLYQKHIDYYFASGSGDFTGSSRAVAAAMARAINLCPTKLGSADGLRSCLSSHAKKLHDDVLNLSFPTY